MNLNRTFLALFLFIETITVIILLWPFLLYNGLYSGDMPGHYVASWYIQNYLFPRAFGWNPFIFSGYPQGQFYPFLFHYLSAILGMFVGLNAGFKLMLCMSVLAAPISFYYFNRKFGLNNVESSLCMLLMWFMMFFPDRYTGGNFLSTFDTGVVTNMMAVPLLFFYYGKLAESVRNGKYAAPSIILAAILLTHIFMAIIALVFMSSFFIKKPSRKDASFLIRHATLSFLLTAFWTVPFIDKIGYSSLTDMPSDSTTGIITIFFILSTLIFFFFNRIREEFRIIVYTLGTIGMLILLGIKLGINMHYYRFFMPVLFLMPICLFYVFKTKLNALNLILGTPLIISIVVTFILSALSFISYIHPYGDQGTFAANPGGIKDINISLEKIEGRIIPVALPGTVPAVYFLDRAIPVRTYNWVLWGLFIESSNQRCTINNLISEFNPSVYRTCGTRDKPTDNESQLLAEKLRIYNVNYVLLSKDANWSNKIKCDDLKYVELDNRITENVTFLSLISPYNDNEEKTLIKEFGNSKDQYIIFLFENKTTEPTRIKKIKCEHDHVSFEITPGEKARVFLSPDFKYWRAYSQGKETVISDGPLMSLTCNGSIELSYLENPLGNLKASNYEDVPFDYKNQTFELYKVGDSSIAEVLTYSPEIVGANWDDTIIAWFNSNNISRILIRSKEAVPEVVGTPGQKVEVQNISSTGEYMKFYINAEKPVPLYIKVTYFPNWKAYVNGRPTQIYEASPHMMLIYGTGIVELKYEPVTSDILGAFLSIMGIIWFVYLFLHSEKR